MSDTAPFVSLEVPEHARAAGPITLGVRAIADARMCNAVGDRLESALTVALLRRDRPGVLFAEVRPPKTPDADTLSLRKPSPDAPRDDARTQTLERTIDLLAEGARHGGSAEYHVIAAFGLARSGIMSMAVEDATRMPDAETWPRVRRPGDDERAALPEVPPTRGLVARVQRGRRGWQVQGAVRRRADGIDSNEGWVNVLALRHAVDGGAESGSFWIDAERDGDDLVARFAIPLDRVAPYARRGRYDVYVTAGDLIAAPVQVML